MTDTHTLDEQPQRIGTKKFVLLHHGGCFRNSFHYQISGRGEINQLITDDHRTQHPMSIAVQLEGNLDEHPATQEQLESLKHLLFKLKLRYPDIEFGTHRQVRGDKPTTCPGRKFQMSTIRQWFRGDLPAEIDDHIREVIESQYRP